MPTKAELEHKIADLRCQLQTATENYMVLQDGTIRGCDTINIIYKSKDKTLRNTAAWHDWTQVQ